MQPISTVDVVVGRRVRTLRLQRDLSQLELSSAIGASVGEMEQFEAGVKRIGATRLFLIADALEVDVAVFFAANDSDEYSEAATLH